MRLAALLVVSFVVCVSNPLFAGSDLLRLAYPPDPIQPGEALTGEVRFDHPAGQPMEGWTFYICHDPAVIGLYDVTLGADTALLNGGAGPDFFLGEIQFDGCLIDVLTTFGSGAYLPVGDDLHLHDLLYDAVADGSTTVDFCAVPYGPPTFVDLDGVESIPPVAPGDVFVGPPVPPDPSLYLAYFTGDSSPSLADPSPTFEVTSRLSFPFGGLVQSWAWSVCTIGTNIEAVDVVQGIALGPSPGFSHVEVIPGQGWLAVCILDFTGIATLPPAAGHEMYIAEYELLAAGPAQICYCDSLVPTEVLLPVPVETHVVVNGMTVFPMTQCFDVDVQPAIPTGRKLYWGDVGHDKIRRANLDGSDIEELVTTGLLAVGSIVVEPTLGKMFWADWGTANIRSANLDGSNVQVILGGLAGPYGIAVDPFAGKIYWSEFSTPKIRRANLDGTAIEDLVTTGLQHPNGVALDIANGHVYWTDNGSPSGKIERASLDGTGRIALVTAGISAPMEIALDVAGGKMVWCDLGDDKVQRANLDGTGIEDLAVSSLGTPVGIAIDPLVGHVYWTDSGGSGSVIQRANLDGTSPITVISGGIGSSYGLTIATVPLVSSTTAFVRGDTNDDGSLTIADAIAGLGQLFAAEPIPCPSSGDVNGDGGYDIGDMISLLSYLFSGGPPPVAPFPACGVEPSPGDQDCEAFSGCP